MSRKWEMFDIVGRACCVRSTRLELGVEFAEEFAEIVIHDVRFLEEPSSLGESSTARKLI
jgi:hypothetical protein